MESPLHHFEVHNIIPIHIGGLDLSISNAVVAMWVGLALIGSMFVLPAKRGLSLVPGRLQNVLEIAMEFIRSMVFEFIGEEEGKKYIPFIASLFLFILACNLIGMVPGSYTITCQIVVTGVFAIGIFIMTLVIGFSKHGLHFFSFFVVPGLPWYMLPILIPIEVISYLARPISLSVRLFANMLAGHTLLKVFAGFVVAMPFFTGVLPLVFIVALTGLEILIAFLQAYVFAILTCLYINDAYHLH